jgi:hypothetical protein
MQTSIRMRKLSYLFVALGVLAPFVFRSWVRAAERSYVEQYGFSPDGTGLFAMVATGVVATFAFFALGLLCAVWSFRLLKSPCTLGRKVELAILTAPPLILIAFVLFGMLGVGSPPPTVIHSAPVSD